MTVSRSYSHGELRADRCIHIAGAIAGVAAALTLLVLAGWRGGLGLLAALAPYAVGLSAMLGLSALYHLARLSPRTELYRRLDHAAIYVLIAGTLTPFAWREIGGPSGLFVIAVAWFAALIGVVLKFRYPRRLESLSVVLYLALGWIGFMALNPMTAKLPQPVIVLLLVGGVFYSLGVAFHLWRRLPYQNVVWHLCVLVGAGCHYAAVVVAFVPIEVSA